MTKKMIAEIKKLTPVEFNQLEFRLQLARSAQRVYTSYGFTHDRFAEALKVKPSVIPDILKGAYNYDLEIIAKINVLHQDKAAEDVRRKMEKEEMQFADYKYQYPAFVERINKLLSKLEQTDL